MKTEKISAIAVIKLLTVLPIILFLLFVCFSCSEYAPVDNGEGINPQTATLSEDNEIPYVTVEELPEFPGGDKALLKFIVENTTYPDAAKQNNTQGRVLVKFCVSSKGKVNQLSILQGVSEDLDNEAMRVVASLPQFKPGRQGGKAVAVWYMVPITFALQ